MPSSSRTRVAALINERFIPLKINGNEGPNQELVRKLYISSFPTLVLASHDGKILPPAIVGYKDPSVLYDHLLRVLGNASDPEWMVQSQQQALKHYQTKDYARAAALLRTIIEDGKTRPIQIAARRMLQEMEEIAQARLVQAREMLKNRQTTEAIEIANETVRNFPGLQAARDASGLLTEVMQSAEVRNQQRGKKAQELLAQAQESFKHKDYFVCLDRCETLVKHYADLPEAQDAYLISANIKSDPNWLRTAGDVLVERLGDIWLASAKTTSAAVSPNRRITTSNGSCVLSPTPARPSTPRFAGNNFRRLAVAERRQCALSGAVIGIGNGPKGLDPKAQGCVLATLG